MATQNNNVRVWKVNPTAKAGVMISEDKAIVSGNRHNYFYASANGVAIAGNSISFIAPSEQQRHGAIGVKMPDLVQFIPATIVTLGTANMMPYPPIGFIAPIIKDAPFFAAMAAAVLA